MQGRYPETESKVWLAVQSSQAAKAVIVQEEGIGEEIPFTLFGWTDDRLVVVCQCTSTIETQMERFIAIRQSAHILRRAWGCDSFTFIAEGFCVLDEELVDLKRSLSEQYAEGNSNVAECLTFMHVDSESIEIMTTPYKCGLGRKVTFGSLRPYPRSDDNAYKFPTLLQHALHNEIEETPEEAKTFYDTISMGLLKIGVACKWWAENLIK